MGLAILKAFVCAVAGLIILAALILILIGAIAMFVMCANKFEFIDWILFRSPD